jgi:hypothetical protein
MPPENDIVSPTEASLKRWAPLLLLIVPLVFYWRSDLFFIWDDWTELDLMSHHSFWVYLFTPDGEILFPVFHAIYYGLFKLFGERQYLFVLINCLSTGLLSFIFYRFLRLHFDFPIAFALSLIYAGATVHQAIVWNAFYLCYILSLIFLLLALLWTDAYARNSSLYYLAGVGLWALLSIHSHNYTLLALLCLPLYVLLLAEDHHRKKSIFLLILVGIIIIGFGVEYLTVAGLKSTRFFNPEGLYVLPRVTVFLHWLTGACLSPFYFLFWGEMRFKVWPYIFGALVLMACLAVSWRLGDKRGLRLGLWAVAFNVLPFFLLSLGRYQFSSDQALSPRYVFFTLIGALILGGVAWSAVSQKLSKSWCLGFSVILVMAIIVGQGFSMPTWQRQYSQLSRNARYVYQEPKLLPQVRQRLTRHHPLDPERLEAIRRFLRGS